MAWSTRHGQAAHWDKIYTEKEQYAVSWDRPHLEKSLNLIEQIAPERSASIIDVGGRDRCPFALDGTIIKFRAPM
jgi:hypothetical protein